MDTQNRNAAHVERPCPSQKAGSARAFTLVEMLTVIALIIILMALAIPAINSMKNGNDFSQAAYNIGGYLDQARSYAMANNTYVFVGIREVDGLKDDATKATGLATGYGRLVFFAAASKDGTAGYNPSSSSGVALWKNTYQTNLAPLGKPLILDNIHMAESLGAGTGKMKRVGVGTSYRLGSPSANSALTFSYPLGIAYPSGQYNFQKVINFDPQGIARIQTTSNGDSLPSDGYMEIGLQPNHGNNTPDTTPVNEAALLFDCMSGTYYVYRP